MLLAALSIILLASAAALFALAGRGRVARLSVPVVSGLVALLSLAWFGLNSVTGDGINDSVFYHMHTGLGGGDVSQYYVLIAGSLLGFLVLCFGCWRLYRALPQGRRPRAWADLAVLGLLAASVLGNPASVDVGSYLARQHLTAQQTAGFVAPQILARPETRKNLIVVYLESLERSYFDETAFPGLIEDLRPIEAKGQSFTGLGQSIGAGFTIGGMVASQCGVPLIISGSENSMQVSRFMTGATCLGDLLKAEGYRTEYLGGSLGEFAGKGSFYESHGFDEVTGLEDLKPHLADPDYLGPWGLQDDTLFGLARDRIDTLAAGPDPFAMVMLTLDTHHPDGHANTNRSCQDVSYGDGSNAMLTSVKCADRLAADFVQDLLDSPIAANTVIVLASDHLAMVNGATGQLAKAERNNFLVMLSPDAKPETIARKGSTLDIGPTIMAALGYDVPQIGFGVNLLGPTPTLAEKQPEGSARIDLFADYLMGFQAVYARLWDYPRIGDGFYVNVEAMQVQFGQAAFKLPALMQLDAEGGIADVVLDDPRANRSLSAVVLETDPATPFLWFDRCATLAVLVPEQTVPDGLCLGSGALISADFRVRPLKGSTFVLREESLPEPAEAVADPSLLQRRQEAMRAALVSEGSLPLDVALPAGGYRGREVLFRSATATRGASWSRLLTTDSLSTGDDILLDRGINLIGVAADGRADVLASLDPCSADVALQSAFKAALAAQRDYSFHAIVVHDTATCNNSRAALDLAVDGLDLPVLKQLEFRQPYVAVLGPDGAVEERVGAIDGRLLIKVGPGTRNAAVAPQPETPAPAILAEGPPASEKLRSAASAESTANTCVLPSGPVSVAPVTTELVPGDLMPLTAAANERMVSFGDGWWDPESAGRWIGATSAELSILVPGTGGLLEIRGVPYRRAELPVRVLASERELLSTVLVDGRTLQVDLAGLPPGVAKLTLSFPDGTVRCPSREGTSTDSRALMAMIRDIRLVPTRPEPAIAASQPVTLPQSEAPPPLAVAEATCQPVPPGNRTIPTEPLPLGARLVLREAETSARVGHGDGWWATEPFGRWIGSASAEISIILPEGAGALELEIAGKPFQSSLIQAELRYRDQLLYKGAFGADAPIVIPVSALPRGKVLSMHLGFADAVPTCPKALGQSGDDRTLVAIIDSVTLRPAAAARAKGPAASLPSVAHAGGEFAMTRLTNSLDALNANSPFHDLFEIDLSWTSDRKLVCLHDWEESFAYRFGTKTEAPLTEAEFTRRLAEATPERPENCTLTSLAQWLRSNPGKRVVTDLKQDNIPGLQLIADSYPDLLDRFLPQAFQPEEIAQIKAMGFPEVIWTLYRYGGDEAKVIETLKQNPVYALTMSEDRAETGLGKLVMQATGIRSYVHTINDPALAACYASKGISGVYTANLRGPMPDATGITNETCRPSGGRGSRALPDHSPAMLPS
jgi:glycerophosphoryl diester phosphodiesterase